MPAKTKTPPKPQPGYDGRYRLGAKDITDPYSGKVERKAVNTRHDVLEGLLARGSIDPAQKEAGDRVRALHERAAGRARGMDYADTRVDGGGVWKDIPATQLDASFALKDLSQRLGLLHFTVLQRITVDGLTIADLARMWFGKGDPGRLEKDYVSKTIQHALAEAAEHFGLQTRMRAPSARLGRV